jgi:hypothetical protein
MEVGAPKFELVPVTKQKDLMINAARMNAQKEYDRIMELVHVLQRQANEIKQRLDLTDQVHAAVYQFQIYHGQCYWLAYDDRKGGTALLHQGPQDWSTGVPEQYRYITCIKFLGDHTWIEVDGLTKMPI